jgi:uncharacterized protein YecT (DUF1311 family)
MRKCVFWIVIGMLLAGCQSTMERSAVKSPLRSSFDACIERAEAVTPAMQDCIEEEYVFQHARMKAALAKLQPTIAAEQQAWQVAKDANCHWDPKTEGQGQRLDANVCSLMRIAERANELEARLDR